jgi:hypothetical protein
MRGRRLAARVAADIGTRDQVATRALARARASARRRESLESL